MLEEQLNNHFLLPIDFAKSVANFFETRRPSSAKDGINDILKNVWK